MALPRTFVGCSSTDILSYRLMCAWKHEAHIDFDFCDCQLQDALDPSNEASIKRQCRQRMQMADTYVLLIGQDTRTKTRYVHWEVEVAIEKGCRLIGINLDNLVRVNHRTCPDVFNEAGAIFVPFSPHIVAYALGHWSRTAVGNWRLEPGIYARLGYALTGDTAVRPGPRS